MASRAAAPLPPLKTGTGPRSALVLVGHGSHLSPDSSAPVYACADRIRALGVFDEVAEAFWKEEPSLRDALDLVTAERVWVVPLFLAEGYFTRIVVPRELGIEGEVTFRSEREIRYCPPIGTHPAMAEMILRRAREVTGRGTGKPKECALLVIGHGTERSPTSGGTVYSLVEKLRASSEFRTVDCGFLDEPPHVADVLATIDAPDIVLVPFFVAEGWHTRTTIPEDLGLTGNLTIRGGRRIWYTPPVGTLDEVPDVVLAIAADAGAPLRPSTIHGPRAAGASELHDARRAFLDWVDEAGPAGRTFLQLHIQPTPDLRYEVRNSADSGVPSAELSRRGSERTRELARSTAEGQYRPLRYAGDLPRGWIVPDLDADALCAVVAELYPGAVLHWYRGRVDGLRLVPYPEWAARQTGIYSDLGLLPPALVEEAVDGCCAARHCLRTRLWDRGPSDGAAIGEGSVPCTEPCTLFASAAREILHGQGQRLVTVPSS